MLALCLILLATPLAVERALNRITFIKNRF